MALFRSIQADPTPRFEYSAPVEPTQAEVAHAALPKATPRSRHAYARDAFCNTVRATGEVFGAVAMVLTGTPLSAIQEASPKELRELQASPVHRVAGALSCGLGCVLGTMIGAATWLNPVDAAHDVATRNALALARSRGERALQGTEEAWDEAVGLALVAAREHPPQRANTDALRERWLTQARDWANNCGALDESYLVGPVMGVALMDRALAKLTDPKTPGERVVHESLRRARRDFAAEASNDALANCHDRRTRRMYHSDSPTLLRFKCALLAMGSPVLASVNVLLTMAFHSVAAVRAGVRGDLRKAGRHGMRLAAAPLLGLGLQATTLAGVLAPNLGRATYARLESPLLIKFAPCFRPTGHLRPFDLARPGMRLAGGGQAPERSLGGFTQHGLGSLPVLGGRI